MVKIAIIDSGVEEEHEKLKEYKFKGINIEFDDKYFVNQDIKDTVGHGTAITYQIKKLIPNSEIYIIKLFDSYKETTTEDLIFALNYIYENLDIDIIHISNGVTETTQKIELEEICNRLIEKGIIIVAAFDNNGAISYPAAYKSVIGVDWNIDCINPTDYFMVKNSSVNFLAIGREQRLPWINNSYKNVSGSSFAAPYITAKISNLINKKIKSKSEIMDILEHSAISVLKVKEEALSKIGEINNAIIFPFNKEIHSIIRFKDMLKFDISGIYDYRLTCNIGSQIIDNKKFLVQDLRKINWNDKFDTFILGHTRILSNLAKEDFIIYILKKCIEYKKNLYAFDSLNKYEDLLKILKSQGNWVYYPYVCEENISNKNLNKLHEISIPVLGIFGTSSKQGKYTLQLNLRKALLEKGYKIGQLGTEPSALLFGMDFCYPIGYDSTVNIRGKESIIFINEKLSKIDNGENDIILVGSQSQTIPYTSGNIGFYPLAQHELLLASNPDAIILCVNVTDEIEYIERTISYIESLTQGKIIALVLFPLLKNNKWSITGNNYYKVSNIELKKCKKILNNYFNKNVFILNENEEINLLVESIIEYFKE